MKNEIVRGREPEPGKAAAEGRRPEPGKAAAEGRRPEPGKAAAEGGKPGPRETAAEGGKLQAEKADLRIEKADAGDFQVFADIIQAVWEAMDPKEWFMADNADYTYRMLTTGKGTGYKAVDPATGAVAGVFMAVVPGLDQSNMGYDAGLPAEELPLVAHMDSAAVLPEYRGRRLQRRLMEAAEKELKERGFRYLMCTVHPDNLYSRNNVVGQGYESVTVKEKYGGHVREIFLKRI